MSDYDSSLPIRTENDGDVVSKIADATIPSQQLKVNADGSVDTNFAPGAEIGITDGTDSLEVNADGSLNVVATATDLDIRDLDAAQDNVAISDGTNTLGVNADGSIDTNFAPGSEIGITDGTDSLEVNADGSINVVSTATDLDIRDLTHVSDSVSIGDGTEIASVNASNELNVRDDDSNTTLSAINGKLVDGNDIGDVTVNNAAGAAAVNIQDGGNSITVDDGGASLTVDAVDLDIRDLDATTDNVAISDGTDTLAINTDGSINVIVSEDVPGDEIVDFNTSAAVAKNVTVNHDYTVTAAKTFTGEELFASGSGKLKVEVQLETAAASGVFDTIFVGFNSTANPNVDIRLDRMVKQVAGAIVRIAITNRDNQAQDVYSTLTGIES